MFNKILFLLKISFIIFAIFFFIKIDFTKLNFFGQNQIVAVLVLIIFHLIRTLRLHFIFYFMNKKITFINSLNIYYIGLSLGIITPGRLGEFYRIKLINDLNISKLSNYNFILIEKMTDIFSIIFFLNIFIINSYYNFDFKTVLLLFFSFCVIILFFKYGYKFLLFFIKKITDKFPILLKNKKLELFYQNNPIQDIGIQKFIFLCLFTITSWLLFIFAIKIGINYTNEVNFLRTIDLFVINAFITALPITIMGIGLREIVLTEILGLQNLTLVAKISLQFILFNIVSIIPGLVMYIKKEYKLS